MTVPGGIFIGGIVVGILVLLARGAAESRRIAREAILEILQEGPSYGLDMVKKSGGRLQRGLIYVHLRDLENEGRIKSWDEQPKDIKVRQTRRGRPRRMYALTEGEEDA